MNVPADTDNQPVPASLPSATGRHPGRVRCSPARGRAQGGADAVDRTRPEQAADRQLKNRRGSLPPQSLLGGPLRTMRQVTSENDRFSPQHAVGIIIATVNYLFAFWGMRDRRRTERNVARSPSAPTGRVLSYVRPHRMLGLVVRGQSGDATALAAAGQGTGAWPAGRSACWVPARPHCGPSSAVRLLHAGTGQLRRRGGAGPSRHQAAASHLAQTPALAWPAATLMGQPVLRSRSGGQAVGLGPCSGLKGQHVSARRSPKSSFFCAVSSSRRSPGADRAGKAK